MAEIYSPSGLSNYEGTQRKGMEVKIWAKAKK